MHFAYRKISSGEIIVVPAGSWKEAHAAMTARHRHALRTHVPLGALHKYYVPVIMAFKPTGRHDFRRILTALHALVTEAAA